MKTNETTISLLKPGRASTTAWPNKIRQKLPKGSMVLCYSRISLAAPKISAVDTPQYEQQEVRI